MSILPRSSTSGRRFVDDRERFASLIESTKNIVETLKAVTAHLRLLDTEVLRQHTRLAVIERALWMLGAQNPTRVVDPGEEPPK